MGFDFAGMGDVAQGESDMRDAQNRQRAASQAAEDNAGRLRQFQQAEVDRQAQSKLISQQAASEASIRNGATGYNDVPINTDATNLPVPAPVAPVGNSGLTVSYPPATPAATVPTQSAGLAIPRPIVAQPTPIPTTPAQATIAANHALMTHTPLPVVDPNKSTWENLKALAGNKYTPEQQATLALPRVGVAQPTTFADLNTANMPHRPITPTPVPNSTTPTPTVPVGNVSQISAGVQQWAPEVTAAANARGFDPRVGIAQMSFENRTGNPNIVSGVKGSTAGGLYQFNDATADSSQLDNRFDPHENINAYADKLQKNLGIFNGDYAKAVAAHHYGTDGVKNAIAAKGADWIDALPSDAKPYVNGILATAGQMPMDSTGGQPPMPTTLIPPNTGTPAAQKIVLDAKKVWNTVSSLSTPQDDAIRASNIKYLNMRIQSSHDPVEQQQLMTKVEALNNEGDEADAMHAYTGASNGDPDAMQALAGIYEERTGSQIGLTMQGNTMVAFNKGADGNPQILLSGTTHDVASKLFTDISPAAKAASLQIQQKAAEAAATEAPKTASAIAVETIKANASAQDKYLAGLTKINIAKIAGSYKLRAALVNAGIKLKDVKVYQGKNPGDLTLAVTDGRMFTLQPGKSNKDFSSPPSLQPIDMSAANTAGQAASLPADVADDGADEE